MGYACPVCSDPQADPGHLANHLAFTAMLGDEPHERWLDEHAPGWGGMGEADLADAVVDEVEETEFPQVFEDTAGGLDDAEPPSERSGALFDDAAAGAGPGNDHAGQGAERERASNHGQRQGGGMEPMDEETEAILEEAREMTGRMLEDGASGDADDGGFEGREANGGEESAPDESSDADDDTDNNG